MQQRIRQLESSLQRRQQQLHEIETELADNDLYSEDQHERLQALARQRGELIAVCSQLEEQWLEASEAMEQS